MPFQMTVGSIKDIYFDLYAKIYVFGLYCDRGHIVSQTHIAALFITVWTDIYLEVTSKMTCLK